jgi:hypothetical protein
VRTKRKTMTALRIDLMNSCQGRRSGEPTAGAAFPPAVLRGAPDLAAPVARGDLP